MERPKAFVAYILHTLERALVGVDCSFLYHKRNEKYMHCFSSFGWIWLMPTLVESLSYGYLQDQVKNSLAIINM